MSIFNFGENERQKKLLTNLVRDTLLAITNCVTSEKYEGTCLQGCIDNLAMKTTCAAIMLAPAKLFNLRDKKLGKFHNLLCKKMSARLSPSMNFPENVEAACRFIVSCMQNGYKDEIKPMSDNEDVVKYFSHASFVLFYNFVQKVAFSESMMPIEDRVAISEVFVLESMKVFALYCDTLKAWDDKNIKLDLYADAELKLNDAVVELEKISKSYPIKVLDWCRKNAEDGCVVEGKIGFFNVPVRCRRWDGPYGIVISSGNMKIEYNVYFRDLISDVVKIKLSLGQLLKLENELILKILGTPKSPEADRGLAEQVLNAGLVTSYNGSIEYVESVREGDQSGLFDDLKGTSIINDGSFEFKFLNENPPWEYQKGCYFEVNIEDHLITAEENRYLAKFRYLYNTRVKDIEGIYEYVQKEIVYDEETFQKIWFAALMVNALLKETFRCYLEFEIYKPFACALKRFDRDFYKIFDALFYHVRERLNEDDSELSIFSDNQNTKRIDMVLFITSEYMENWLFRDELSANTKIVMQYFKESLPIFAEKFEKDFSEV